MAGDRRYPQGSGALAARLLAAFSEDLSDWEEAFLESVVARCEVEEFTTRQAEKLLEIRDGVELVRTTREGFSVEILIEKCHLARLDLIEADEEWLAELIGKTAIRRSRIGRLLRCARELYLIEDEAV